MLAIALTALVGASYAVWSTGGSLSVEVDAPPVNVPDTTYHYLVFEIAAALTGEGAVQAQSALDAAGKPCVFYAQWDTASQKFVESAFYAQRYGDAYDVLLNAETMSGLTVVPQSAAAIGYTGTLGQYEPIVIPSQIELTAGGSAFTVAVTAVDLMTPEEFPALDLIREIRIPASVPHDVADAVDPYSFKYCQNLQKVVYSGAQTPVWAQSLYLPRGAAFEVAP